MSNPCCEGTFLVYCFLDSSLEVIFLYRGLIPYFIYKENKVNRIEPAPCNTLLHFLKNADLIISPHPHWLSNLMCRFWNFCLVFFLLPLKLAFSILNQSLLMKFHCQYKSKGGNFKFHSSVIAQTNQSPIPEHGVQKCPFYPSLGILCNFDSNHYLAYYSLYTDNMYSTYMHIPISFWNRKDLIWNTGYLGHNCHFQRLLSGHFTSLKGTAVILTVPFYMRTNAFS